MVSDRSLNLAMMFFVGLFAMVFLLGLSGCSNGTQSEPNVEVIQDMMEQPAIKAQDVDPHTGHTGQRVPPAGTVAMNREVYPYKKEDVTEAEKNLKNPNDLDNVEVLALGEKHFKNYCFVCHGEQGKGDGPVADRFIGLKPPSIVNDRVKGFNDGRLFHIVTQGTGMMGAYINQMPWSKDRWAVVNYVRKLQKNSGASSEAPKETK